MNRELVKKMCIEMKSQTLYTIFYYKLQEHYLIKIRKSKCTYPFAFLGAAKPAAERTQQFG